MSVLLSWEVNFHQRRYPWPHILFPPCFLASGLGIKRGQMQLLAVKLSSLLREGGFPCICACARVLDFFFLQRPHHAVLSLVLWPELSVEPHGAVAPRPVCPQINHSLPRWSERFKTEMWCSLATLWEPGWAGIRGTLIVFLLGWSHTLES